MLVVEKHLVTLFGLGKNSFLISLNRTGFVGESIF